MIVIRGPLGVGKTTVSKLLAQNLQAEYVSVDTILNDNNLANDETISLESFLKVNKIVLELANKSEKNFVVDGNFYYQEQIDDLQNKFKNDILIFTLITDVETCIERDFKREKTYGEDSVRYVHMITSRIKSGYEVDTSRLKVQETVENIMMLLKN